MYVYRRAPGAPQHFTRTHYVFAIYIYIASVQPDPEVRTCIIYNNKFILKLSLKNTRSRIVCSHLFRFAKRANNTSPVAVRGKNVYIYMLLKKITHQDDANRERVRVNTTASAHIVVTAARWITQTHALQHMNNIIMVAHNITATGYFLYNICDRFRVREYTNMCFCFQTFFLHPSISKNRTLRTFILRTSCPYVIDPILLFCCC